MKKKLIILISLIIVVISITIGIYFWGLTPVSKSSKPIEFVVPSGAGKMDIVDSLKDAGLVKSKFSLYIYMILHNDLNLQAGKYELNTNMGAKDLLKKINDGKIITEKNTFNLTFIEGRRLTSYAQQIGEATNLSEEEVLKILSDKEYLQKLISEYWFLTDDILKDGVYYPLEGYLFPSTYEFYKNSSVKDIVKVMLDTLGSKLKPFEEEITSSGKSVQDIVTMASIVELEGANSDDRRGVAGVFYNRLKIGDSLGSDVTTYYAARKDFSTDLKMSEINDCNNGYNTRGLCNRGKLPIGPICSPSMASLEASINPEKHDYYFFVADKNKKTYFTKTNSEHINKVNELKSAGLWYEYK